LRAFEKHVVVRIRADVHSGGRADPETLLADRVQRTGYDVVRSLEPRAPDNLFILGIDVGADTELQ
jgi:hypothetical protein